MGVPYQLCVRCVMDTTDSMITFDDNGVCSHCRAFEETAARSWFPNDSGAQMIAYYVDQMKAAGQGKDYDCVLGISGGIDSAFLAYQMHRLGLRPLVIHVDTGWNSELAVKNIENLVRKLGFDLHTQVINWEEMKDLQVAFLRAGVANQDTPQDHAIFASLYRLTIQTGIRYIIQGYNFATELTLPRIWGHDALDSRQLRAIHHRFGKRQLTSFPVLSYGEYAACRFGFPANNDYISISPLNYMHYDKQEALTILHDELGFRDYGAKHHELRFTKFFQGYYLPTKFGYDKRTAHLSSLIMSGQMTRSEALEKLRELPYDENAIADDTSYFCKKLGLTEAEFTTILKAPNRSFMDYPNWYDANQKLLSLRDRI